MIQHNRATANASTALSIICFVVSLPTDSLTVSLAPSSPHLSTQFEIILSVNLANLKDAKSTAETGPAE